MNRFLCFAKGRGNRSTVYVKPPPRPNETEGRERGINNSFGS